MSVAAQTLRPPSKTLLLLEGRAFHELGAFLGALPLLSLAPKGDGHPVLVLPGLVASDVSTRPLRKFLETRGYAVCGWRLGRNLGLRDGVQDAMVDLVHELNDTHGRTVSLVGWSSGWSLRAPARQDDAGACAPGDHPRQSVCRRPEGDQRLARLRDGQRAPRRRGRPPLRRIAHRRAAGADHRDLQPHRRHLRLAELPRGSDRDVRKHRGGKQPLRHGPSSGRGLRGRRSSGAGRRRMVAVRSLWLARSGLSGSAPLNALAASP